MNTSRNKAQVHVEGKTIVSKLKRNLRKIIKRPRIQEYIKKKEEWTEEVFQEVDWEAHEQVVKNAKVSERFITKLIHDILPTGKTISRYKPFYDKRCPSCMEDVEEDRYHLLRCRHEDRIGWRNQLFVDL